MKTRELILTGLFGSFIAFGAIITVPLPLTPVPVTLQVFFICLVSALLGARIALYSVSIYLVLGFIGLPVFAGGKSGIGILFGPTGGYLYGFLFAGFIMGLLIERKKNAGYVFSFLSMLIGIAIIYMFGSVHLMLVAKLDVFSALISGVIPFILPDIIKAIIATYLSIYLKSFDIIKI
ncbi:MAG: biotin transporter BioY [Actinomycetia bacterium]|nr:biotin transporter BioY [Actinomycetes bacterium]